MYRPNLGLDPSLPPPNRGDDELQQDLGDRGQAPCGTRSPPPPPPSLDSSPATTVSAGTISAGSSPLAYASSLISNRPIYSIAREPRPLDRHGRPRSEFSDTSQSPDVTPREGVAPQQGPGSEEARRFAAADPRNAYPAVFRRPAAASAHGKPPRPPRGP